MKKTNLILLGVVAVAVFASVLIQRRNQAKLSENDALLQQQDNQLAELAAENQRLSNLVFQTRTKSATAYDPTLELANLRTRAQSLREQTNQLTKQLAENRRFAGAQFLFPGGFQPAGT